MVTIICNPNVCTEVYEQLICEVTGHPALPMPDYKPTNTAQNRKMSAIVQGQSDLLKCCTTHSNTCLGHC